nr:hypothetical protein [Hymenobacter siberiensis]
MWPARAARSTGPGCPAGPAARSPHRHRVGPQPPTPQIAHKSQHRIAEVHVEAGLPGSGRTPSAAQRIAQGQQLAQVVVGGAQAVLGGAGQQGQSGTHVEAVGRGAPGRGAVGAVKRPQGGSGLQAPLLIGGALAAGHRGIEQGLNG